MSSRFSTVLVSLALAAAVLALYVPLRGHGFLGFDDDVYITENPHVRQGISWPEIRWVFGHAHAANYHPLTWVSHMLDVQLFGLDPGAHHLVSAFLHAANAVLCFLALRALTRQIWPALLAAAFFALHPLRVESVAWASERKDVLCATFALLTILSYARYARAPALGRYLLVCLSCALALLAKPMAVTLPLVLLLLDFWPLGRLGARRWRGPWLEKLPLFALAALAAVVTLLAQRAGGATSDDKTIPLDLRALNAVAACGAYLAKTLWPAQLAAFYPHPAIVEVDPRRALLLPALASAGLLLVLGFLSIRGRRSRPFLLAGGLWFLVMLLPVIGLIQVGTQAYADRYTYLPSIGLCIAACWLGADAAARWPLLRPWLALSTSALITLCALQTARQIPVWKDGETLYRHALEVTAKNYTAHNNLGAIYLQEGKLEPAETHLREALGIRPDLHIARNNLGLILARRGELEEARREFETAVRCAPRYGEGHNNLAVTLERLGRDGEAAEHYRRALQVEPPAPHIANNLALLLATSGDPSVRNGGEAQRWAAFALQAGAGNPRYLETLAAACAENGDFEGAVRWQQEALSARAEGERAEGRARLRLYQSQKPLRK